MSAPTVDVAAHERGLAYFNARCARGAADDCWKWNGPMARSGYGHAAYARRSTPAHRLAYLLFVGPVPDGRQIDHLCRNRECVNPAHLEAVTPRENTLRGVGITAQYARATHCIHGHEFTPENTRYWSKRPSARMCRTCLRAYLARRRERRRAERREHAA